MWQAYICAVVTEQLDDVLLKKKSLSKKVK